MSISAALSNAMSGLTVASRSTEVVTSNIANALTPGYGTRQLEISSRTFVANGGGVRIDAITRLVPASILADFRLSKASVADANTKKTLHVNLEKLAGGIDDPASLSSAISGFNAALAYATASPGNTTRLDEAVRSASAIVKTLNSIAKGIQSERTQADQQVGKDVNRLNTALADVAKLNRLVTTSQAKGEDTSALLDARQAVIDDIAELVPLAEIPRSTGAISLFTKGGIPLLDGNKPAEIGFRPASTVTPQMSVGGGRLSLLTINGESLTADQMRMFRGGQIAGNFAIRDDLAPAYQSRIDDIAATLVRSFSSTDADPTLTSGDQGLFTDPSGLGPDQSLGLANRVSLNPAVDPSRGGQSWRLRDGLNAAVPGSAGNADILSRLQNVLNAATPEGGNAFSLASDFQSLTATNRVHAGDQLDQVSTYSDAMNAALLAHGVDSDKEMENLLRLQQAYAANAKVLQTVSDMLDNILRLT